MKVVIDTNVYISGIFWSGAPREILNLAREKNLENYISAEIIIEVREKLIMKFNLSYEEANVFIFDILTFTKEIEVNIKEDIVKEDKDDNKFIECALQINADYIISGDSHLTNISQYKGIKILNPRDFLKQTK